MAHLYKNPDKYGIIPDKIGLYGVSGGGYELSGTGMLLAERDESYMAKSFYMVNPMLDDTTWTTSHDKLNVMEIIQEPQNQGMFIIHGKGLEPDNPYLYPSKMHEYLIQRFPMTVIATGEFDQFHAETKKFARRL